VLRVRALAGVVVVGALLSGLAASPAGAAGTLFGQQAKTTAHQQGQPARTPAAPKLRSLCGSTRPGYAHCNAVAQTDVSAHRGVQPFTSSVQGLSPADLRSAYKLPSATATQNTRTIAIIDAYNDPRAESDLAVYRKQFGLPPCTTSNGCFSKVNQYGGTGYPPSNSGWAGEISLDVDMASAICSTCHILLVEATNNSLANLGAAVNRAVAMGAKYVSNSYGGPEYSGQTAADSAYFRHPGVAITVSAGDQGYGVEYPASSPYVTAVGGTTLQRQVSTSRGWTETAWAGTGSGCSRYSYKPTPQTSGRCTHRIVADVSAVADPYTGVAVYNSYSAGGWTVYGGTSAAAPIIAGVYALAGAPRSSDMPHQYPYARRNGLWDITRGSNGSCGSYLCKAVVGYDGPTGLGTPRGASAFTTQARPAANTLRQPSGHPSVIIRPRG